MPAKHRRRPLDHDPASLVWARKSAKVSQRALERELGLPTGYISYMERGALNCPPELQSRIAAELHCPAELLARRQADAGPPLQHSA